MTWILDHVPFPFLFVIAVAVVVGVWRLLGVRAAVVAGAVLGLIGLYREGRKGGRETLTEKAEDNARDAVREGAAARVDAELRDADPERLRESDGFRRD
ncbi:MAG: hypothetical protein IOB84_13610 [Brevundimonas sp.]|nr:hypothetical protein [Brevundimonas sp.]